MGWQHRQPDNRKEKNKIKKKLWVWGVTWQEEGQSNFLYFVTWNLQGIYDRNCRPRRHGGLSLCSRQIFISPIWGWYEYEIFLLIISARRLKERERERERRGKEAVAQRAPTDVMHVKTNVWEQKEWAMSVIFGYWQELNGRWSQWLNKSCAM